MVVGFILLIGTAGASDTDMISMDQILTQCAVSIGLILVGGIPLRKRGAKRCQTGVGGR